MFEDKQRKLCIICSKGTLDMAYPGLVLANAALMEGIDVTMFFTFWGFDIITEKKMDFLKCTPLANPSMAMPNGMGIPNAMAILPGMTDFATTMMRKEIAKLDFPPVREYLQMIADAGGEMYACKMSMDMMGLTSDDLFSEINAVVGAMEFMEMSEDAQIIFI
ncbi:MAG: DsrE/DsrF/DrsH-like family protein [Candidatus Promineifilaceae bacterium]|nr:DsrE/DsrF/DrsH-like family protein [Candidatus Promineifilaceae bacterium]